MSRIARTLGLHGTFYSEKRHRRRFDVGVLVTTLRELGVSPATFFAELEGSSSSLWGPIAEHSTPDIRRAVRLAYRRMRTELGGVDLVAELEDNNLDEEPPTVTDPPLDAAWLEGLDGRRQDAPEEVAAEVAAGLDRVEAAVLPRALGVWGSACCLLLELETAAYLNRWAVRLAEAAGDSTMAADLYLRRGNIIADAGNHQMALTLGELAIGIFARIGSIEEKGRALVSCGRWLHYLGRHRESIEASQQALDLLPDSAPQYRLAAYCNLAHVYLAIGEPHEAQRCQFLAEPFVQFADSQDRAKVHWLRATVSRQLGQLAESEQYYRQSLEMFRRLHHGEAALCGVELVRVVIEQGKPAEAARICQELWPLLEPLQSNRIVEAAVGELLRAGARGSLSLDLVRQVKARLEGERARRPWRALEVTT